MPATVTVTATNPAPANTKQNNTDINTTQRTAALGASGEIWQQGTTQLRVKLAALRSELASDGGVGITQAEMTASQARLALELTRPNPLTDGSTFEPSARFDSGDGVTGSGIALGGGLSYRNPATGITVDGSIHAVVGHSGDYEELGFQGTLRLQPGADGQGLSFTLTPRLRQHHHHRAIVVARPGR